MACMGEEWGPGQNQDFINNVEEERDNGYEAGDKNVFSLSLHGICSLVVKTEK